MCAYQYRVHAAQCQGLQSATYPRASILTPLFGTVQAVQQSMRLYSANFKSELAGGNEPPRYDQSTFNG